MKGHLRTYQPVSQLDKLVPQAHIPGRDVPEPAEEKPPLVLKQKCSKCKATKQLPTTRKCQSCGGWVCVECFPGGSATEYPCVRRCFAGAVDPMAALQLAGQRSFHPRCGVYAYVYILTFYCYIMNEVTH